MVFDLTCTQLAPNWQQYKEKEESRAPRWGPDHRELLFLNNNTVASSYSFTTIIQTGNCPWALSENSDIMWSYHFRRIPDIMAKNGSWREGRITSLMLFLDSFFVQRNSSRQNGAAQEGLIIGTNLCCLCYVDETKIIENILSVFSY